MTLRLVSNNVSKPKKSSRQLARILINNNTILQITREDEKLILKHMNSLGFDKIEHYVAHCIHRYTHFMEGFKPYEKHEIKNLKKKKSEERKKEKDKDKK